MKIEKEEMKLYEVMKYRRHERNEKKYGGMKNGRRENMK